MYVKYSDRVAFFLVYIREAHPTDGRRSAANDRVGITIEQPKTLASRMEVAETMCAKLDIKLPAIIDGMDNKVNEAYSAQPDRLYLISRDGKIAYKGGPGPWGFKPSELEAAIVKELGE